MIQGAMITIGGGLIQSGGGSSTLVSKTITANGVYDPADDNADGYSSVTVNVSGGGVSLPQMSVSGTNIIQDAEVKLSNYGSPYILPLSSGSSIVVDVTQAFEIGITFKADSLTSTYRILSGSNGNFYKKPWSQLMRQSDTTMLFYAVFPTDSSAVTELYISPSELPFVADAYFTVVIAFDGTNTVSLSATDGTNTVTKQGTVSSLYSTSTTWALGRVDASSEYRSAYGITFDFAHCYLKQSGTLVWGNE